MIILFAQTWPLLPAEAPQSAGLGGVFAGFGGLLLPICTLAAGMIAAFSRYPALLGAGQPDRGLRPHGAVKGQSERRVLVRHVLRNALIPVVTPAGHVPARAVRRHGGGRVPVQLPGHRPAVLERRAEFGLPGAARVTLVVAAATVLGSLLADLVYALLDPRIRTVPMIAREQIARSFVRKPAGGGRAGGTAPARGLQLAGTAAVADRPGAHRPRRGHPAAGAAQATRWAPPTWATTCSAG
ncbi:hypothetical protein BC739_009035 [Kutzneria viridogrisea]|uniref:ABC transmembrane type-1 domain-containing protein n=1 Tax=Kutzneria viridogrisea TaxID=47990 RepID=A0ABR6BXY9_9PSEU|nr:hypothetical protein [Kutzneria viridogrisea]